MSNQKEKKNFYTEMMRKVDFLSYFTNKKSEKKLPKSNISSQNFSNRKRKVFILMHVRKQTVIAQDFSALFGKNNLQLSLCPSLRSSINQSSFFRAQTSYKIPTVTFLSHFAMLVVKI